MPIAEGVATRVAYKFYSSGDIASATEPNTATDPGASSAVVLRRVGSTLDLTKATYESAEIRADRQVQDFRHGMRSVTGALSGEISPGTWFPFLEAACRGSGVAPIALSNTELTSAAADNALSTITFAGGDPVALGLGVGDVIRLTNMTAAGNNNTNFTILSFGGTSNRTLTVTPTPTTQSADTTFNLSRPGRTIIVPASGHVRRKLAVEAYAEDLDIARLFTECRVSGFRLGLPATGMATIECPIVGRNMQVLSGASAPYFTSPTAPNTQGITAAVNGVLRVSGSVVGVVTGIEVNAEMSSSMPAVVGQNIAPDILLGRFRVTGQVTALFENATLLNAFLNETDVDILARLDATTALDTNALTIHLPRVKFGGGSVPATGEGEQIITLPFQALLPTSPAAGVANSTIRIHDTAAT
jgi:hypothetical protein